MNVYSMNKAGKGVQHRPVINPNGTFCFINHSSFFFSISFLFFIGLSNYSCYFDPFEKRILYSFEETNLSLFLSLFLDFYYVYNDYMDKLSVFFILSKANTL